MATEARAVFKKPSNQWMARNMNDVEYLAYFLSKCIRTEKGCLEFQGSRNTKGYGSVCVKNRRWILTRFVYTMTKGAIPAGHMVLHSCDNPPCCNPAHLNVGTMIDNAQDSADKMRHFNGRKKECKHGHAFTPENTRTSEVKDRPGLYRRHCIECEKVVSRSPNVVAWRREYQRKRRAEKRGEGTRSGDGK